MFKKKKFVYTSVVVLSGIGILFTMYNPKYHIYKERKETSLESSFNYIDYTDSINYFTSSDIIDKPISFLTNANEKETEEKETMNLMIANLNLDNTKNVEESNVTARIGILQASEDIEIEESQEIGIEEKNKTNKETLEENIKKAEEKARIIAENKKNEEKNKELEEKEKLEKIKKAEEKAKKISEEKTKETKKVDIQEKSNYTETDLSILSRIIEAEAGGEPYKGKVAVGAVIVNRTKDSRFPDTIKGVVFQKKQFTPISDGRYNSVKVSDDSIKAAKEALNGIDNTYGALFFYSPSGTSSRWHETLKETTKIGKHVFYKK